MGTPPAGCAVSTWTKGHVGNGRLAEVILSPMTKCEDTRTLFETGKSARFRSILKVATRKLTQLEAAATLEFLRSPPGNRLEAFEIVDYH